MAEKPLFRPHPAQFYRTRTLRAAVYRAGRLSLRHRILDVGCGDGAVAAEMALRTGRPVTALDPHPPSPSPPSVRAVAGNACALPFLDGVLDAVSFHFVLLWLADPVRALREAWRVLKPGGALLILAEPDITGRLDQPDTGLGRCMASAVLAMGGHADAGARIPGWLELAGFRADVRATPPEAVAIETPEEVGWEIAFLRSTGAVPGATLDRIENAERSARQRRVILPICYGIGTKVG